MKLADIQRRNADRILKHYPKKRIKALVLGQKCYGGWSHVNWERVEAGISRHKTV